MDAEADQLCGEDANSKKRYYDRTLDMHVGALNLRIQKQDREILPAGCPQSSIPQKASVVIIEQRQINNSIR